MTGLLTTALGRIALTVKRRLPMIWRFPEPPSARMNLSGWSEAPVVDHARVLYVGHSLVGPHLAGMTAAIAESLGASYRADTQRIDGGSLQVNWSQAERSTGVRARDVLTTGEYDVFVMTEAVNLDDMIRWSDPPGYVRRWSELARTHRDDIRLYFYETWHDREESRFRLGGARGGTWREDLDLDLGRWEHIVDEAERRGPKLGLSVVPGGQCLAALVDAIRAGEVPGVPTVDALFCDTVHPSTLGFYYVALVHVATVLRRSPVGATNEVPTAEGGPLVVPEETARAMQEIAWRSVRAYPRSGLRVPPAR